MKWRARCEDKHTRELDEGNHFYNQKVPVYRQAVDHLTLRPHL